MRNIYFLNILKNFHTFSLFNEENNFYDLIISTDTEIDNIVNIQRQTTDTNNYQKLSSLACKIIIILVSSTIKIIRLAGAENNDLVNEDYASLQNVLSKLCTEKKIPPELNVLYNYLSKYHFK